MYVHVHVYMYINWTTCIYTYIYCEHMTAHIVGSYQDICMYIHVDILVMYIHCFRNKDFADIYYLAVPRVYLYILILIITFKIYRYSEIQNRP